MMCSASWSMGRRRIAGGAPRGRPKSFTPDYTTFRPVLAATADEGTRSPGASLDPPVFRVSIR
eukprot:361255-Chlamydomonas_euryale.AAC.4